MKIVGVHIYGFGKLVDVKIKPFSTEFQAFFGNNEAGKSTLMSFIQSILFGFPTKHQSKVSYEPKTSTKFGGKVFLETNSFGSITIERVKSNNKVTGEVKVSLPDGTIAGEEILQQLFKGIDKTTYQRIYSFDIHGLQKVHLIKSADLGKYLFSSGMIGTDVLSRIDNKLQKELEKVFKPNGKKPLINDKLQQLKELHQQLIKNQENNSTYNHVQNEIKLLSDQLVSIDLEKEKTLNQLTLAESKKTILPLLKEKTILLHKLEQLPAYETFPVEGIQRYEKLKMAIQPYETQRYAIEKKLETIQQQLHKTTLTDKINEQESTVQKLLLEKSLIDAKQAEMQNIHNELEFLKKDIQHFKEQLNNNQDEEVLLSYNTSISRKQYFQQLAKDAGQLEQQKQHLDKEFNKIKMDLEASEYKISQFQKDELGNDEREKLLKLIHQEQDHKWDQKELELLAETLQSIDKKVTKAKKVEKQKSKTMGILSILCWVFCAGLLLYGLLESQYGLVAMGILIAIIVYLFQNYSPTKQFIKELIEERADIIKKQAMLKEKISLNISYEMIYEAQTKLAMDDQLKSTIETEKIILKQLEQMYEKNIQLFEVWETSWFELKKKISTLKEEYHLENEVLESQLVDIFQIIKQAKEDIHRKNTLNAKYNRLNTEINNYYQTLEKIKTIFQIDKENHDEALFFIKQVLNEEKNKQKSSNLLKQKYADGEAELKQIIHEWEYLHLECLKLFEQAQVENETEFLTKGKAYEESLQLQKELAMINGQLSFYEHINVHTELKSEEQLNQFIQNCITQISLMKEEEKKIQEKLAKLHFTLNELEKGGEYSSQLQHFNLEKSQLQEMVRDWSVVALAKEMLTETVNIYKNERLPLIIAEVEKNLAILTDGEYQKVFAPNEQQTFIVERKDGVRFTPDELSQATAEQLYTALRFALATKVQMQECYPIIIDDSFVNFDKNRTKCVFNLLHEISKTQQVIFFSCHHQLEAYLQPEQIMKLS